MAEASRQTDNEPGQVYDEPTGTAPSDPKPNLNALESGSETTEPKRGHQIEGGSDTPSSEDLSEAEDGAQSPETPSIEPESYYAKNDIKRRGFLRGPLNNRRKRTAITGSIVLATIISALIIFISLLPLKIEHVVKNLQNHFYSTSENAIGNESQSLLSRYIVTRVLPGYTSCGTTIDRRCSAKTFGTNPVSNTYKSWANARLENRLAEKYGIEFQRKPDGWYVKGPGISAAGDNIGTQGERLDGEFQRADRRALRQATGDAFQSETKWKQVYYRFKVGKLLEEKYGVRRCLIFCAATDPLAKKVAEQKIAAKLYLVQRVLTPRNQTLGIALQCLFTNCAADQTSPTKAEPGTNGALNGAPENPETDTAIRQGLTKLAAEYGVTDIEALVSLYKDISEKGFQTYLIEKALTPVIGETASGSLADKIPIAGWIDLTARLVNAANDSSHTLKKLSYVTNASAAVALFTMYRSYADEIHTGHITGAEVGSLVSSLSPGNSGAATDPEVGGTAGAEVTPLYHSLIDPKNTQSTATATSILDNFFIKKTYAASTTSSENTNLYKCNDGNGVPAGQLACSEEVLGQGNHYADLVHEFLNLPGVDILTKIAQIWSATFGQVFDFVNGILGSAFSALVAPFDAACKVPVVGTIATGGYCEAKDLASKAGSAIMNGLTQWLIPNPFSSNMSGGRTFDMMAAGADVAGNDSAHTTLGGQELSSQQVSAILTDQQQQEMQSFAKLPLLARIFKTDNSHSFVSKLALEVPLNFKTSVQSIIANFMSNPLGIFSHSIGFIFANQASAATATTDPFGVVQYGYPAGTIPPDPENYWNQHCSDNASHAYQNDQDYQNNNWNQAAADTLDPNTQMPVNTQTNPCLLIMATVGSDGAIFDSNLLTADDLAGSSADSTSGSTAGSTKRCGGNGNYSALVSSGANFAGIDQGIDFVPTGSNGFDICAPASGTIVQADATGHHFDRTNGQAAVILKMDQAPNTPNSGSYIYFIELIQIDSSIQIGKHVNKGDVIGHNAQSPGIEVGWASGSGGPGSGLEPLCGLGGQTTCGDSFNSWVLAGGGN